MTAQWVMYGIKNCDTIKKARRYLEAADINVECHDYRASGLSDTLLSQLIDRSGYQTLLNTRGTTWRKLTDVERDAVIDAESAKALMLAHPAVIKRPVLRAPDGAQLVGFSEAAYKAFIQEKS